MALLLNDTNAHPSDPPSGYVPSDNCTNEGSRLDINESAKVLKYIGDRQISRQDGTRMANSLEVE